MKLNKKKIAIGGVLILAAIVAMYFFIKMAG